MLHILRFSEDINVIQENGKFIGQHLKNMNTLDQSRQKVKKIIFTILIEGNLFSVLNKGT